MSGDENNGVVVHSMPGTSAGKEMQKHQTINHLIGHAAPVLSCGWSGDGSILLTADADGAVCLWLRDSSSE